MACYYCLARLRKPHLNTLHASLGLAGWLQDCRSSPSCRPTAASTGLEVLPSPLPSSVLTRRACAHAMSSADPVQAPIDTCSCRHKHTNHMKKQQVLLELTASSTARPCTTAVSKLLHPCSQTMPHHDSTIQRSQLFVVRIMFNVLPIPGPTPSIYKRPTPRSQGLCSLSFDPLNFTNTHSVYSISGGS